VDEAVDRAKAKAKEAVNQEISYKYKQMYSDAHIHTQTSWYSNNNYVIYFPQQFVRACVRACVLAQIASIWSKIPCAIGFLISFHFSPVGRQLI